MAEKESRQGQGGQLGVSRSEVTRRTLSSTSIKSSSGYQANTGKLEVISSMDSGHRIQGKCDCEKCVQRKREKQMLAEYNQKFSNLLAEKDSLIKRLQVEKRALQEGKNFIKETITSRYEEIVQERETLIREKVQEIGELQSELSRLEGKVKDLEQNTTYLRGLLDSKEKELMKMKDLNMENSRLKREKAENDRKIRALEEKLLKEIAKNKNLNERKYEKHLEEIDRIVEKYCKNFDGSNYEDISKKLEELQESFVSKQNYEAEIRRREREASNLKEKLKAEEQNVAELSKESGKLTCQLERVRAELESSRKKLADAERRLTDEESIQRGEIARLTKIIEQLERNIREMEKSVLCQCNDCIELRTEIDIYGTLLGSLGDSKTVLVSSSSSSSSSEGEGETTAQSKVSSKSLSTSSTLRRIQQQQTFKQSSTNTKYGAPSNL